jgi:hypothetical protein
VRRPLVLLVLFIVFGAGALLWLRTHDFGPRAANGSFSAVLPSIEKQPPTVATRRFNPASPPPDMPPLHVGEQAQCESDFMASALVSSQRRRTGATGATLTITQVKLALQLGIVLWVPEDVSQKVLEHEEGHRQISESYYAHADKVAARVAASYIGKELAITGGDIDGEADKALQNVGSEITAEYIRQLDPNSAQLRYDEITDHARNDVLVRDAVSQVLGE